MSGGIGDDEIAGDGGYDLLFCNKAADTLFGNHGRDLRDAGAGGKVNPRGRLAIRGAGEGQGGPRVMPVDADDMRALLSGEGTIFDEAEMEAFRCRG